MLRQHRFEPNRVEMEEMVLPPARTLVRSAYGFLHSRHYRDQKNKKVVIKHAPTTKTGKDQSQLLKSQLWTCEWPPIQGGILFLIPRERARAVPNLLTYLNVWPFNLLQVCLKTI